MEEQNKRFSVEVQDPADSYYLSTLAEGAFGRIRRCIMKSDVHSNLAPELYSEGKIASYYLLNSVHQQTDGNNIKVVKL
jgi:hypothetical protein